MTGKELEELKKPENFGRAGYALLLAEVDRLRSLLATPAAPQGQVDVLVGALEEAKRKIHRRLCNEAAGMCEVECFKAGIALAAYRAGVPQGERRGDAATLPSSQIPKEQSGFTAREDIIAEATPSIRARALDEIGEYTAWPLRSVLNVLANCADHLLGQHNCDCHGHEECSAARDAAKQILHHFPPAASQPDTQQSGAVAINVSVLVPGCEAEGSLCRSPIACSARSRCISAKSSLPSWCANPGHSHQPHINNGDCEAPSALGESGRVVREPENPPPVQPPEQAAPALGTPWHPRFQVVVDAAAKFACDTCGAKEGTACGPSGFPHSSRMEKLLLAAAAPPKEKPPTCGTCGGQGQVPIGGSRGAVGQMVTSRACRSCGGTGAAQPESVEP